MHDTVSFGRLQTRAPKMMQLLQRLALLALSHENVLILGETGVGKELIAEGLHRESSRARAPFVVYDCAGRSTELALQELFDAPDESVLEQARGGTLVLDHVDALSVMLQRRLLEALPLPSSRVLSLSSVRLADRIGFSRELLRALAVSQVTVPPLRERLEDLPLLADALLREAGVDFGPERLPRSLWQSFEQQPWRGNVRELKNALLRFRVMSSLPAPSRSTRSNEPTDFVEREARRSWKELTTVAVAKIA